MNMRKRQNMVWPGNQWKWVGKRKRLEGGNLYIEDLFLLLTLSSYVVVVGGVGGCGGSGGGGRGRGRGV